MLALTLDPRTSRLTVRTRAVGVFARLAHDLELAATDLRLAATLDGSEWTALVTIPVISIRVAGTLRGERLDPIGLVPRDRADVERRLRDDVLAVREVVVRGKGALDGAGTKGSGELSVDLGSAAGRASVSFSVRTLLEGAYSVTGRSTLSLTELGIRPVKGPLGAFKLKDDVDVLFEITLRPEAP
jgi:hypothetical protein